MHIILGTNLECRAALEDLCTLLRILDLRPTHVRELVPDMPQYVGYHDVAAEGAGGVWFSLVDSMSPMVWQAAFPQDIASKVVSNDNPDGRLTNSDLELAAEVMAVGVALAMAPKVKHVPLGTLCNNTQQSAGLKRWHPRPRDPRLAAYSEAWWSCCIATRQGNSRQCTCLVWIMSWQTWPHARPKRRGCSGP